MRHKTFFLLLTIALSASLSQGHAYFCSSVMDCFRPVPINCRPDCGKGFISVGGGYSWSIHSDICATTSYWDASPQGYDDDIGNSPIYTFGVGYHTNTIFSFLFETSYRPSYEYSRYQTSTITDTPGFIGNKTRYFKVSCTTFTFNGFLNKQGNYCNWTFRNCFTIAPYVGGGLGVSYNTLYDFHSVLPHVSGQGYTEVRSIMNYRQNTSFAGQAMIGLTTKINQRLSLDFGYRWFYGGYFKTNNYITNVNPGTPTIPPSLAPPWKGKVRANELYVNLNYDL